MNDSKDNWHTTGGDESLSLCRRWDAVLLYMLQSFAMGGFRNRPNLNGGTLAKGLWLCRAFHYRLHLVMFGMLVRFLSQGYKSWILALYEHDVDLALVEKYFLRLGSSNDNHLGTLSGTS